MGNILQKSTAWQEPKKDLAVFGRWITHDSHHVLLNSLNGNECREDIFNIRVFKNSLLYTFVVSNYTAIRSLYRIQLVQTYDLF